MSSPERPAGGNRLSAERVMDLPAAGPRAEKLYLDLMKRCLTRYDIDADLGPIVPHHAWQRKLWQRVARGLSRWELVVLRRAPFQRSAREEGLDWPATAETMIGLRRLDNIQDCIERAIIDGVPGDFIEAGVWRGGAAIFMRAALAALGETDRVVWVADSFQGLPKPRSDHHADQDDEHWTQPFLAVSLQEVRDNFARYGLLDRQVRFLPGWFSKTLPDAPIRQLAVLRVDGDMYGSTTDALCSLYPKLSVGGFAIIDDYGAIPACRAAVEDYRARHGITEPIQRVDWTGVYWQRER